MSNTELLEGTLYVNSLSDGERAAVEYSIWAVNNQIYILLFLLLLLIFFIGRIIFRAKFNKQ